MLVQAGDVRLNVVDEGRRDAPAVMFSHSLAANLDMWAPQAAALRDEFRVIRYDTRGHGASDAPGGAYSLPVLCADVVALLDALAIERVHFVGLSLGGMTAMGLALDAASRVASITAACCTAQTPDAGVALWDERIATARQHGMPALAEATLARWFTADMLATRTAEIAAVRAMILATPVAGYVGCCEALKGLAYRDRLAAIRAPALFIAGALDPAVPLAAMQDMHGRVAGSGYIDLPGAHLANLECAAAFNAALLEFLRAER